MIDIFSIPGLEFPFEVERKKVPPAIVTAQATSNTKEVSGMAGKSDEANFNDEGLLENNTEVWNFNKEAADKVRERERLESQKTPEENAGSTPTLHKTLVTGSNDEEKAKTPSSGTASSSDN